MRTLYDDTFTGLDISSEQELAQFTVTGQSVALIVMVNVDNLSGVGGDYSAKLSIDNRLVVPDRKVKVEAGNDSVSFQSRDIVLYENGILKVNLQGTVSDTNVSGRLLIIDTSPVTVEEVSDLISDVIPDIISAIQKAMKGVNIIVKPETKILGPCRPKRC